MEKRIEVEINGRKHMIMPHMLEDFERLGANRSQRTIKNAPPELSLKKELILPATKITKLTSEKNDPVDVKANVLPKMQTTKPKTKTKPIRKTPVKSKSTK